VSSLTDFNWSRLGNGLALIWTLLAGSQSRWRRLRMESSSSEQDDRHDYERRGRHPGGPADRVGGGVAHHAAAGSDQNQEKYPQQLSAEAPPFLTGIIEIGYPIDNLLLV
jgi:hypothetical protein